MQPIKEEPSLQELAQRRRKDAQVLFSSIHVVRVNGSRGAHLLEKNVPGF